MKFILDYAKWRSGGYGVHQLGQGFTRLSNAQGFQCCLGQWLNQLGVPESKLMGCFTPADLPPVSPFSTASVWGSHGMCTELARNCIWINDDPESTPEQKISRLR